MDFDIAMIKRVAYYDKRIDNLKIKEFDNFVHKLDMILSGKIKYFETDLSIL